MALTRSLPALALLFSATACGGGDTPDEADDSAVPVAVAMVDGSCEPAFEGEVCTWAETTDGDVTSFGATVPMAFVESSPMDAEMVWPPAMTALVELPNVVRNQLGVHSVTVFWEAHGHPPGPYLVPHFDFHFYTISPDEVAAIDCADTSKPSNPPAGYALPDVEIPDVGLLEGLCVPGMGMHSLLEEELMSEETFSGTMVIGYYASRPIFFEPMITRELFMERQTFSLDMPAVPGATIPTIFEARFDEAADAYRFVFAGLE